jgi:hypothetical protein
MPNLQLQRTRGAGRGTFSLGVEEPKRVLV